MLPNTEENGGIESPYSSGSRWETRFAYQLPECISAGSNLKSSRIRHIQVVNPLTDIFPHTAWSEREICLSLSGPTRFPMSLRNKLAMATSSRMGGPSRFFDRTCSTSLLAFVERSSEYISRVSSQCYSGGVHCPGAERLNHGWYQRYERPLALLQTIAPW
jgi:hypothetical protein